MDEISVEKWNKLKDLLFNRQIAYRNIFNVDSPFAVSVLEDLAFFCRAHDSTFHKNDRAHALMEGRREVWLRIQQHLELDSKMLWKLYGRQE